MTHNKEQRRCMALKCKESGLQDLKKLFKFPKNEELKQKWLENLCLKNSDLRSSARSLICRRHFLPMCVAKKRLNSWALPTLHLGTDKKGNIHQPIQPYPYAHFCCIKNCKSQSPATLYLFPKQPELRAKWVELCGVGDEKRKNIYICGNHFRPSFKMKKQLRQYAYPELNLNIMDNDPLQESIDNEPNGSLTLPESAEIPLEESVNTDMLQAVEDTTVLNCDQLNSRSRSCSISSKSSHLTYDEEDEESFEIDNEQESNSNCQKCVKHNHQCRKMQKQIKVMRNKIIQLENKLHLQMEDEEEYIWLLFLADDIWIFDRLGKAAVPLNNSQDQFSKRDHERFSYMQKSIGCYDNFVYCETHQCFDTNNYIQIVLIFAYRLQHVDINTNTT